MNQEQTLPNESAVNGAPEVAPPATRSAHTDLLSEVDGSVLQLRGSREAALRLHTRLVEAAAKLAKELFPSGNAVTDPAPAPASPPPAPLSARRFGAEHAPPRPRPAPAPRPAPPRARPRAANAKPAAAHPVPADRLQRRTPETIAGSVERVVDLLKRHPGGLRSETIRAHLGMQAREMPRVLSDAVAQKRARKKGQKRATMYFATK